MQNELNELRHQVRTLKRVVYGACGLLLVGGLLAATSMQSVPDVIQAHSFEVVNDEGKVLVGLGGNANEGYLTVRNVGIENSDVTLFTDHDADVLLFRRADKVVGAFGASSDRIEFRSAKWVWNPIKHNLSNTHPSAIEMYTDGSKGAIDLFDAVTGVTAKIRSDGLTIDKVEVFAEE